MLTVRRVREEEVEPWEYQREDHSRQRGQPDKTAEVEVCSCIQATARKAMRLEKSKDRKSGREMREAGEEALTLRWEAPGAFRAWM